MTEKFKVFVYGTLKRNQRASSKLAEARYVGLGKSMTVFEMYGSKDQFPMIFDAADGRPVLGEVYEVSEGTFQELDKYEGYPNFYNRKLIYIQMFLDSRLEQAWVYYVKKKTDWVEKSGVIMPNANGDLVWPPSDSLDDVIPF